MKKLFFLLLIFGSIQSKGSDLSISQPILYQGEGSIYAVFNLKWKNAWKNDRNHDAVWLFSKLKWNNGGSIHIGVSEEGHQVLNNFSSPAPDLSFQVANDGRGLFVYPNQAFRGDVEVTLKIGLNPESFEGLNKRGASLQVFGIEMVQIPEGSFYLGSPDEEAIAHGAFYSPDNQALIKVKAEDQSFNVSADGDLYYKSGRYKYEGDQQGQIPATYPKGVQPFYIMKYELREGQYVDFLNTLFPTQLESHKIWDEKGYNGKIVYNGKYSTPYPLRPCSFVSWDDAMAYADWAALRPMTEFEFVKAARGPVAAKGRDYPWGSSPKELVQRLPDENGVLRMLNNYKESELSDENKHFFGASYYWVMDLSGGLWERVVSVGHEKGRSFTGTHGDGNLTEKGAANNPNWPIAEEESGGIGFRGGGFYGYDREYHTYNPFSPISFRPYGGWHGGMRSIAYGTRFVRTSN